MSDAISKAIEAMEWMMVDYEHLNVIGDSLSANWVLRVQAVKDAITSLQAMQGEAVARVIDDGTPEGATEWIPFCHRERPLEVGDLLYTAPQPVVPAAKVWNQAEGRDGKLYTDGWNDCRDAMLSAAKGETE